MFVELPLATRAVLFVYLFACIVCLRMCVHVYRCVHTCTVSCVENYMNCIVPHLGALHLPIEFFSAERKVFAIYL